MSLTRHVFLCLLCITCTSGVIYLIWSYGLVIVFKNDTYEAFRNGTERQLYMSIEMRGRLGNQMCQYAALMGIASRNGFTPVLRIGDASAIIRTFQMSNVPTQFKAKIIQNYHLFPQSDSRVEDLRQHINATTGHIGNIRLKGYFQRADHYFQNIQDIIRSDFTPKDKFRKIVNNFIRNAMLQSPDAIKVGIHIRRGDFLKRFAKLVLSPTYYWNAIDYYQRKFGKNTMFFVACEDKKWANKNIQPNNTTRIIHSPFDDYSLDFTLLYSCDHMITSAGTFSWWAGWLTKGLKVTSRPSRLNETSWVYVNPS